MLTSLLVVGQQTVVV